MVYPARFWHISVIGSMTSGADVEQWSFGFKAYPSGGQGALPTDSQAQAVADAVGTAVSNWWTSGLAMYPDECRLMRTKVNFCEPTGRYAKDKSFEKQHGTGGAGVPGTSTTSPLPAQLAVTASLRTAATRGLASKGRVYLPATASGSLTTGGRIEPSHRDLIQSRLASLLSAVNDLDDPGTLFPIGFVVVGSDAGAGTFRRVSEVSVGDRYDVQRRRANGFKEARSATSAVTV